jgi:hypothetical protein
MVRVSMGDEYDDVLVPDLLGANVAVGQCSLRLRLRPLPVVENQKVALRLYRPAAVAQIPDVGFLFIPWWLGRTFAKSQHQGKDDRHVTTPLKEPSSKGLLHIEAHERPL